MDVGLIVFIVLLIVFFLIPFSYYVYKGYKGSPQKRKNSTKEQQKYKDEKSTRPELRPVSSNPSNINAEIVQIAEYQRWLLRTFLAFLLYMFFLMILSDFANIGRNPDGLFRLIGLIFYFNLFYNAYNLAKTLRLDKPWQYIIYSLIPVLNLLCILFVSHQATKNLKEHSIRVGLLGIRHKDLIKLKYHS
jgi:hypothetical protein